MRSLHEFDKIYLHRLPVDGRKWINGLSAIVEGEMDLNAFGEGLFAFTNRRRTVIKLLHWDKSGFAIWMKRLEEEKFRWPLKHENDTVTISSNQLEWLLGGIDIMKMKPHTILNYQSVS